MSYTNYPPPGGPWTTYGPVASAPGTRRRLPPALLPAILLIVAGALTIVSSFLTIAETTHRLLEDNSTFSGSDSQINVTTTTAWSTTFSVAGGHVGQPFDGWGLVFASAIALLVAVLLLVGLGRWAWTKPLAAVASGLLAGVVLMSVLAFAEVTSWDFHDKSESVDTSAGPAVWLQIPAGVLAILVAILAMSGGRGPLATRRTPSPNTAIPLPPNPQPQTYYTAAPTPDPPLQQAPSHQPPPQPDA